MPPKRGQPYSSVIVRCTPPTIAAFLYNITAALVGGVHLTMTDE